MGKIPALKTTTFALNADPRVPVVHVMAGDVSKGTRTTLRERVKAKEMETGKVGVEVSQEERNRSTLREYLAEEMVLL
jgi:hypothetical protein